jgi:hypothetical protein
MNFTVPFQNTVTVEFVSHYIYMYSEGLYYSIPDMVKAEFVFHYVYMYSDGDYYSISNMGVTVTPGL